LWEFSAAFGNVDDGQTRPPHAEDVRRLVLRIAYLWRQRTSQLSVLFNRWEQGSADSEKPAAGWEVPSIEDLRRCLHYEARQQISSLADKELADLPSGASEPFGTTLLAAALWVEHLLLLRMGDGAIIVAPASGDPFAWHEKSDGKAFSNSTSSMLGSAGDIEWELFKLSSSAPGSETESGSLKTLDPRYVVLVTDGVSDPYLPKDIENRKAGIVEESARVLGSRIRPRPSGQNWQEWCEELTGFLASLSKVSGDDATLAALNVTDIDCWWAKPQAEKEFDQPDAPPAFTAGEAQELGSGDNEESGASRTTADSREPTVQQSGELGRSTAPDSLALPPAASATTNANGVARQIVGAFMTLVARVAGFFGNPKELRGTLK
jgi:hypothetical protein